MANGSFFVSWELWQQMTLVLALGIVAVFCAGLARLWWANRLMRRQEALDEEKRARLEEMRRTGIPIKRANDVPFGVRAIQGGVEVDGIWISRPASSNGTEKLPLASSTSLVETNSVLLRKEEKGLGDEKSAWTTPMTYERGIPRQNAPDGSIFQRLAQGDSLRNGRPTTSPTPQYVSQTRRPSLRTVSPLNEDTLRSLEGQTGQPRLPYGTYIPTSPQLNPHQASHRSSESSSGESVGSQTRSARSASGKSASSSHSSRPYKTRHPRDGQFASSNVPQIWGDQESQDPFRTPSGLLIAPHTEARGRYEPVPPEPTLSPGDLHFGRSSRRASERQT